MFVIPCKYVDGCLIVECVKSIRELHPNELILVVDSDSDDKSYHKELLQYDVLFADIANKNYESGAFWFAAQHFIEEKHYVVIQDSIILKQNLDFWLNSDEQFYTFINFEEDTLSHHMMNQGIDSNTYITRINELMGDFYTLPLDVNVGFTGVFGPSFIIKRNMVDLLINKNLHKTLLPVNKLDHEYTERVYGIVASICGVDVRTNTLVGNLHQLRATMLNDGILETPFLNKKWLSTKRK